MKKREALGVSEMIMMQSCCIVKFYIGEENRVNIADNSMEFIYETAWKNKVGNVFKTFYTFFIYKKKYISNFNIKDVLYTPFLLSPSHQEDKRSMARIQNYWEIVAAKCNSKKTEFPFRLNWHSIPNSNDKEWNRLPRKSKGFPDFEILLKLHICKWSHS